MNRTSDLRLPTPPPTGVPTPARLRSPRPLRLALLLLALAGAPLLASAQQTPNSSPPGMISYQGYLTDANGIPLGNGNPTNYLVQFHIYNSPTTTTALWGEQQVVTVDRGYFTVLLGAGSADGNNDYHTSDLTGLFNAADASSRYLGLTVVAPGAAEIQPRLQFLAAPYALLAANAVNAATVGGQSAANASTPNTLVLRDGSGDFSAGAITLSQSSAITVDGNLALYMDGNQNSYEGGAGNTTGSGRSNTAVGYQALSAVANGSGNIALGFQAGVSLHATDSFDIDIGNTGVAGDFGIIRLGTPGTHTNTYLAGLIYGNAAGLTNLNGANLVAGSVGTAQLTPGARVVPLSVVGTSLSAVANTSYVITNTAATTISLPANANVGDMVQVTGAGLGSWTAGYTNPNPTWTLQPNAPLTATWLASSSDGTHLVAGMGSALYTSINSGTNWVSQTNSPSSTWGFVASSSDGTRLVAATTGQTSGSIYTSATSGTNWTLMTNSQSVAFGPLASSTNGSRLVALTRPGYVATGIYTSTNYGTNWALQTSAPTSLDWMGVASSSDGTHLVAVAAAISGAGWIYTSTNSGTNWARQTSLNTNWNSVASSADGTHLVAVCGASSPAFGGSIYTSTNSGTNWWLQPQAPNTNWSSVASSADGTHLVADVAAGGIYTSTNSGTNWTLQTSAPTYKYWGTVVSSSDGTHLAALGGGGIADGIYTLNTSLVPISSGAQGSTALLQYLGNGVWGLVSGSASGSSVAVVNQGTGANGSGAVGSSSGLATALVAALAGQPPAIGGSSSTMSGISAMQELTRRLAARDADVAHLRADKDALAGKVAALEARLARLESRLNENATGPVRTSLERK